MAWIFTPLKKTQNTPAKSRLKEALCPHLSPFLQLLFCPVRRVWAFLFSLCSAAILCSVSNLRISPDYARGRADYIFHTLMITAMLHELGRAWCIMLQ